MLLSGMLNPFGKSADSAKHAPTPRAWALQTLPRGRSAANSYKISPIKRRLRTPTGSIVVTSLPAPLQTTKHAKG